MNKDDETKKKNMMMKLKKNKMTMSFEFINYLNGVLQIKHDGGFFSCCSIKLQSIVKYINLSQKMPKGVDSSQLFDLYKEESRDLTLDYFEDYNNINQHVTSPIYFINDHQYMNYDILQYKLLTPLILKYFYPSLKIVDIFNKLQQKYDIIYDNTLAVYYRGTDKHTETPLASFNDFYEQIIKIVKNNNNIKILIQTDTASFIDYINHKDLKNIIIINENAVSYSNLGIHNVRGGNYEHMLYFLSTVLMISKCKYIICGSGNCSLWMMLYRQNSKNVIQYLNGVWHHY